MRIDLNSDLGESFGAWKMGMDAEVLPSVTSANVACGWHGGDPLVMEKTVDLALKNGVAIGAHPSFPDLLGFGRRNMSVSHPELKAYVKYQIGALWAFVKAKGASLQHVKAHGAMYNQAATDYFFAMALAEAIREVDDKLIFVGLSGSRMIQAGLDAGIQVRSEVFADRTYQDDGTLTPRNLPGAVIHDAGTVIGRVIRLVKEGKIESINGKDIGIRADTICVHGDNPEAVVLARSIRAALEREGIEVKALR
ncbi:MAG: LamB/YcsF family protein [Fusobacteriaceae bacterium]|jgi:UPF0271 protein|nr:LamB/YcsF family protein [Fusobacteriaceae bacterium]